jgi:hypothetical protein
MFVKAGLAAAIIVCSTLSAAHAEDAVVPDAWEQTREVGACDAYGPGFKLVPGTGTCLRIGGQLRYEQTFSSTHRTGSHGRATIEFETRN